MESVMKHPRKTYAIAGELVYQGLLLPSISWSVLCPLPPHSSGSAWSTPLDTTPLPWQAHSMVPDSHKSAFPPQTSEDHTHTDK